MKLNTNPPKKNPYVESYFAKNKEQPIKNVHSYMSTRSKVMTKQEVDQINAESSTGVYRIYQWNEDPVKQKYDRVPLAGKIGSIY